MDNKVILVKNTNKKIIDELVNLEKEAFGIGGMNEWHLVPLIRHGKVFLLMTENDEILGAIQYLKDWEDNKAYAYGIAIFKEKQNRGLGTFLFKESLDFLKKEGINKVELTVDPMNERAIKIYKEKLGFEVLEYRKNEYGENENRLVMELIL